MITNSPRPVVSDFSSLYNPGESILHPEYRIFINTDTSALLFFKVDVNELKRSQDKINGNEVKLSVKYVLRDNETNEIVDSNTNIFRINLDNDARDVSSYVNIRIPSNKKYRLIAGFWNESQKNLKRILDYIDNSSEFSENQFIMETADSLNNILMYDFVNLKDSYKILSRKTMPLQIEYYKFPPYTVRPPYSTFVPSQKTEDADSVFDYRLGDTINFDKKGFYILRSKQYEDASLCIISAGNTFPEILTVGDMLEPLKLITTAKEYSKILESEDIKKSIDEFWLSRSNNQRFAKEQIRVYYSRVKLANIYFSDNNEGWKTDRGNIYIMFGPPSVVKINGQNEEWYYGENPDVATLSFVFEKKNNPFSTNSYQLIRDNMYQPTWAQALSTWRKGRVFAI